DIGKALLRDLRNCIDLLSTHRNRHQVRLRTEVVVPEAMMRRLKVPRDLSARSIQAQQGLGIQVGARPSASVEIVARRGGWNVQQPALGIDRQLRPYVCVSRHLPGSAL